MNKHVISIKIIVNFILTKLLISEPLAMSSAAGWYIGQLCKEGDFPMPFDRFTEYMSKEDALELLKKEIF